MKHVLIINLGGIDDLLLSTPALWGLGKARSKAEISVLVPAGAYDIIKGSSYVDRVFTPLEKATDSNRWSLLALGKG